MKIKLVGGPLDGREVEIKDDDTEVIMASDDGRTRYSYCRPGHIEKDNEPGVRKFPDAVLQDFLRYGGLVK